IPPRYTKGERAKVGAEEQGEKQRKRNILKRWRNPMRPSLSGFSQRYPTILTSLTFSLAPDLARSPLKPRWAKAPSKFVTIDGLSVHLRDEGPRDDPHPIVLIHGPSASLHTWEGWVASLKGQHRVISLDLPGFGLTGPFPDDDYRIEHYTRFMGVVLDQLGV